MGKTVVMFRGTEDAKTLVEKLAQVGYPRDSYRVYIAYETCDGASFKGSISIIKESQTILTSTSGVKPFAFNIGDNVTILSHRRKRYLIGKNGVVVSRRIAHGKPLYNMKVDIDGHRDLIKDSAQSSLARAENGLYAQKKG